ncbi:MAG: ectoine/hydroxyectoine ABC transporter permease subunit EhuC [Mesorhizobium sp.]|uniref:ectoine/hydroxyectoine ABC transporter permease subunit EhuC n=1 Tax=Mesorhizobium sp. TaxID=1871066 RepID=UPI00121F58E2|nr:ectoine/hydroxyectoine ABC transporter permease subunit EhuC [Mesorhizobium sp.]TIM28844.1 MAG: ectoine/hydroxyectoine ABC transporter permease subunit EhuC [Mesorhizobium sp.]TIO21282.1 MAG: ectoine/hydroxyectoine ABC transporter permease subunit EhuC [Mesorhizobium sp.]
MTFVDFIITYCPRLLSGTIVTVEQFALASALCIFLALLAGLMKLSPRASVRACATIYVEIFRGTSLLVQLYWIFFVLPLFGITLDKFTAGFVAVGLNVGAYGAELVRGGVLSVPAGQWEAAVSINMSPGKRMSRIILPQALVNMLPAWGNLLIELLKGTALVATIAVADLTFEARQINYATFMSAQSFGSALIIYYCLARFILTPFMRRLEKFMARQMGKA